MAVAYVNSASTGNGGSVTTLTVSAFNSDSSGSATNTAALLCLATGAGSSAPNFTWNGSATGISQVGTLTVASTSIVWLFGLVGITGTHNAVANWTGTNFASFGIISFSGVNQASVAAAFANFGSHAATGSSTNAVTLTGAVNDLFAVFGEDDGGTALNSITNGTQRFTESGNGNNMFGATAAGAASTAFTLNLAAADDSGIIGCDVVAAGGADVLSATPQLLFM